MLSQALEKFFCNIERPKGKKTEREIGEVKYYPFPKRSLDVLISLACFFLLSPIFFVIIIFIKMDSNGGAFFKHRRIGQNLKPFNLIKFRTMAADQSSEQGAFKPGNTKRITRVGAILRRTKLDELPEILNVLNGDMSIIGPRPEVEKFVLAYRVDFESILKIKPGLSDYASIKYRNEEEILKQHADPEGHYFNVILPDKLRLAKRYLKDISFKTDMLIVCGTLRSIVHSKRSLVPQKGKCQKQLVG